MIRPAERRRDFNNREAQRRLQQKETQWAPVAYGIFLLAMLLIGLFAYSSYAFSRYRGVILPGVKVDQVNVGGLTQKEAATRITLAFYANHQEPVRLVFGRHVWNPTSTDIGVTNQFDATAKAAMDVGRRGSLLAQWIDRLPLHPSHSIALLYTLDPRGLQSYLVGRIAHALTHPARPAALMLTAGNGWHVVVRPSRSGTRFNLNSATDEVRAALGSLRTQTVPLQVDHVGPAITDDAAVRFRDLTERFLAHPPVIAVGKRVFLTSRVSFGPMLSFADVNRKGIPTIEMTVNSTKLHTYIAALAGQVDRPALEARLQFEAAQVRVIRPQQNGRTLDQDAAYRALLPVITGLMPNARLHFKATITQPPVSQTNPASLGIDHLLGVGVTSFAGAGPTRFRDITSIAKQLDQTLITPTQDISFNTLIGSNWLNRMYLDRERQVGTALVPAGSGAMQQVATTFLRGLFASGLKLEERHAHVYRLPWYEPPIGFDAIVSPARNWDLRFANSTGKYLLLQTRVEPIRQELYIYVYGPNLHWRVSVDQKGKVAKVYKHGSQIERQDPSLAPGEVRQTSWATDGADTVVRRTITKPDGTVLVDEIDTHYEPASAIINVGNAPATATPTPTASSTPSAAKAAVTVTPSPSPQPSPTPTFNH